MAEVNRLEWDAYIKDSELMQSIGRIERRMGRMVDDVKKKGNDIDDVFSKMAKAATAYFSITQAQSFVRELVNVRSEFQQLEIAFGTMLGSKEKADQLTKDLIEFAAITPFGMKDAANAAKQLLAYGSSAESVKDELKMLGDVAAGTSQPIGDLVYLYGTLRTQGRAYMMDIRQFAGRGIPIYKELATVLGVAEGQVNDLVSAGKVGFAEIEKAFENMTATGSMFGGLMEAQSKTIQGELERLGDAYDVMLNQIGKDTEGTISQVIQGASAVVENYETVLTVITGLVTVYGAYRAALIATAALQQINAARAVGMTAAEMVHLGAITAKTAAMKVLNAVMLASPVAAMTAAISALAAVIYSLTQVVDATSAAQVKLNEVHEVGASKADQERRSIEQLVAVIKDNTASAEQKHAAYEKLQSQTGGILSSFSQEEIAIGKATTSLDEYIDKLRQTASARAAFDEYNKLADQLDELNRKGIEGVGMWTRLGRSIKNTFISTSQGIGTGDWARSLFDGDFASEQIVTQEREVLEKSMDELRGTFGEKWGEFLTGVKKEATKANDVFSNALQDPLNNWKTLIDGVSNKAELDSVKKAVTEKMEALSPTNPQLSKYRAKLQEIARIEQLYSISKGGSQTENRAFQDAERYTSILADIEKAKDQVHYNQLSRDEQEIESTKAKYDALRNEIRKFNADPRNKTKVDASGINDIEDQDLAAIRTRQANDKKLKQYDEDYRNFLRYEELKKQAGLKYADDQLGQYRDTVSDIQNEINSLQGRQATEGISPVDEAYLKDLEKKLKEHNEKVHGDQISAYLDMLKISETVQSQELAIRKRYQDAYAELEKAKTSITAEEFAKRTEALKKGLQEELSQLFMGDLQGSGDWSIVFEKIMNQTREGAQQAIETLKSRLQQLLNEGKITAEEFKDVIEQINGIELDVSLKGKPFADLKKAIKDYRNAKDDLTKSDALGALGEVANQYFQGALEAARDLNGIFDQLNIGSDRFRENFAGTVDLLSNAGNLAASIASGNVVGIITNGVKTLASAINLFSKDKKFERQIKEYQRQLDSLGRSFAKLQDQISNSVGENFYKDSKAAIDNLKQRQQVVQSMLRAEQSKKKTDSQKVAEYRNELDSIDRQIKDIERTITETLVQTTFKSLSDELANALVSAFEAGEDAIENMDKVFDQFIKNALVNSLKLKYIEPIIDEMIKSVSDYMQANNNSLLGYDFERWKKRLEGASAVVSDALGTAYDELGLSRENGTTSNMGDLAKGLTGITESTANRLEAEFGGLRLAQLQLLEQTKSNHASAMAIANKKLSALIAIQANTLRTADNTEELFNIRFEIAEMSKKITNGDALKRGAGL